MNNRQDRGFWYHQEYDPIRNGSMDGTDIAPHDHGLQRASRCHYNSTKDPSIQTDPYKTLFVGRLRPQTTEDIIKGVFERYGPIQSVRLVRDIITGYSKGYAFVEFKHERDFETAFYRAHRIRLDDAQIVVDYMREQTIPGWIPRRLGGGVGGKRPSGQMRFGGRDCAFRAPFNSTLFNKQSSSQGQQNNAYQRRDPDRREGQQSYSNQRREPDRREGRQGYSDSRRDFSRRDDSHSYSYQRREPDRRDDTHSYSNQREEPHTGRRDAMPQRRDNSSIHRITDTRSRSRSYHRHRSRSRSRDRNRSHRHRSQSHDRHSHNHRHHWIVCKKKKLLKRGIEPQTFALLARRSNQLSYSSTIYDSIITLRR